MAKRMMRVSMALTVVIFVTFAGFQVSEPGLGLLGFASALAYLGADWSS